MRKDDIEKEIENRTPIDFKFDEINKQINYSRYVKPAKIQAASKTSWTKWLFIGAGACAAIAVVVVIPVLARGGIGYNSHSGAPDSYPSGGGLEPGEKKEFSYTNNMLEIVNFGEASKISFKGIAYNKDALQVASVDEEGNVTVLDEKDYFIDVEYGLSTSPTKISVERVGTNEYVYYKVPYVNEQVKSLKLEPVVSEYALGGSFRDSDLRVSFVTNSDSFEVLPSDYIVDYSSVDFNKVGTYPISVSVKRISGTITLTQTYNVTVKYADDIEVSGSFAEKIESSTDSESYAYKEFGYFNGNTFVTDENEKILLQRKECIGGKISLKVVDGDIIFTYDPANRVLEDLRTSKKYIQLDKVATISCRSAEKQYSSFVLKTNFIDLNTYKFVVSEYGMPYYLDNNGNERLPSGQMASELHFSTYIDGSLSLYCY